VLIEAPIYEKFTKMLADRAKNIRVGHPLDPATEIGPLIHPRHFEKVTSYFEIAKADGATIAAGGAVPATPPSPGNYVPATLFCNAKVGMRIAQEEIFGPVLTAIPFKDEAEALSIANAVPYGLAGYIWTNDIGRALRLAQGIDAGMLWVNSENVRHLPTPFGGMKSSGIGRDGGDYSFDFYMETKNIALAMGSHKIPKLGA
jgi:5-carboxymethyl-2-hydroxymuconic-semialdehyde dehydrogenase